MDHPWMKTSSDIEEVGKALINHGISKTGIKRFYSSEFQEIIDFRLQ